MNAMLKHNENTSATVDNSTDTAPEPIIMKRDPAGNLVCFLLNTLKVDPVDKEKSTIGVWHVSGGRTVNIVPVLYYHSCKRIDDVAAAELSTHFARGFQPKFGIDVRHRLAKDLSLHNSLPKSANDTLRRSSDNQAVQPLALDLKMKALESALTVGISTAISAVFKEFNFQGVN